MAFQNHMVELAPKITFLTTTSCCLEMSPNVYKKGMQIFGRNWLNICELSHVWSPGESWGIAGGGMWTL